MKLNIAQSSVLYSTQIIRLTPLPPLCVLSAGPASVLREGFMGAELPTAILLVSRPGVCWASPPHHRPLLFPPGEAQAQLPGAQAHLPLRRSLQVRCGSCQAANQVSRWPAGFIFFHYPLHSSLLPLVARLSKEARGARLFSLIVYVLDFGRRNQWNESLKCIIGNGSGHTWVRTAMCDW